MKFTEEERRESKKRRWEKKKEIYKKNLIRKSNDRNKISGVITILRLDQEM